MATLTANYAFSNGDTTNQLRGTGTIRKGRGESFTAGTTGTLYSIKFNLRKAASPTGNYTFRIYAHTGVFGTSSLPGSLLATSATGDAAALTTSFQEIELLFSGANAISISASTNYIVMAYYDGGDNTNFLESQDDRSSPSYAGNYVFDNAGVWTANTTIDQPFEVYVSTTSIKTVKGLAIASVKTVNGLAIASVKTIKGLA